MARSDRQTLFLGATVVLAIVGAVAFVVSGVGGPGNPAGAAAGRAPLVPVNPLQAARAYEYLKQVCALGPRWSGSTGMQQQQALLEKHFTALGGKVSWQRFRVRHPITGAPVTMANLIVTWHPETKDRVLLCAHYDTRPFPDQDPDPAQRRGVFIGANDGGSGVAALMELAHLVPKLEANVGVDFVLFDGEELVYDNNRDPYFLGSRYFSQQYVRQPPDFRYRSAVLLDMVADKHLQLYYEVNSIRWRDSRPLVKAIWQTAQDLGVREFVPRRGHEVRDDHLMLHNIAKIPACDIIDFDYDVPGTRRSFWHTRADTPDKCSGESIVKVGWVLWEWLHRLE